MDYITNGAEKTPRKVEIDDEAHAKLLRGIIQNREFNDHSDSSNVSYAFKMTSWVADHFEYLTYARSYKIAGDILPVTIKELIGIEWVPHGELHIIYPSGSSVSLEHRIDRRVIHDQSRLDRFIVGMVTNKRPFPEIISETEQAIEDDSSLLDEHLMLTDTVTQESATINWHYPNETESGLILKLNPTGIRALPYGKPHVVDELLALVTTDSPDIAKLAKLAAELAVLAAEHCPPRTTNFFTDIRNIESFASTLESA